ncbi:MAG: hypothetical protein SPK44_06960 [Oscillospiraceae bacterium]|nr:hypothetical protein [Oscillospiraceae bacterium]
MRSIAHYDHGQKSERMKFLRIIFGCPEGARKWRILFFAMLLHSKNIAHGSERYFFAQDGKCGKKMPICAVCTSGYDKNRREL